VNVFSACVKAGFFLMPLVVRAAESDQANTLAIDPMASATKVIVFLLLIVGLIVLLAWLAGKTRAFQGHAGSAQLKTLGVLPLGIKEKIAVIQVGDKQLVVGITPQQITCLTELDTPLTEENDNHKMVFSELLKKAIRS